MPTWLTAAHAYLLMPSFHYHAMFHPELMLVHSTHQFLHHDVSYCCSSLQGFPDYFAFVGIGRDNEFVGRGMTDYPIWYRHFVNPPERLQALDMPSTRPPRNEPTSTKLLIRHKSATMEQHSFDIIVELGAQCNQGRFVDADFLKDDIGLRRGYMLCEIVFQFYSGLIDGPNGNAVVLGTDDPNSHAAPVMINMRRADVADTLLQEARTIAGDVFALLGAEPVLGEPDNLDLQPADVGGVAHEVGTLRMPVRESDGGLKKGVVDVSSSKDTRTCGPATIQCFHAALLVIQA